MQLNGNSRVVFGQSASQLNIEKDSEHKPSLIFADEENGMIIIVTPIIICNLFMKYEYIGEGQGADTPPALLKCRVIKLAAATDAQVVN